MTNMVISDGLLWAGYIVIIVIAIISSIILNYHWKRYGMDSKHVYNARKLYFAGVVILLAISTTLAILITTKNL